MRTEALLRALADPTRLRIVRLLGAMELAVGELAQVLGQSQPRVSRHVGILCDAGLAERRREGSWVFLRAPAADEATSPANAAVIRFLDAAESQDLELASQCADDRRKLNAIRSARETNAEDYFVRHADEWDDLRRRHSPDELVEQALLKVLGDAPLGNTLDIGTGTGRMAEMFAPAATHVVALDKNLEMLRIARAKLQNLPADAVELVQGDFADLPFVEARFDTVLLHQVLHFAQDPKLALTEAARVLKPGGRIAIIDFASHDREELRERHAHAWLGFEDTQIEKLLHEAGVKTSQAIAFEGEELVVKIWLGERLSGKVSA
ncbi:MAG: metalloregulator ArsR/SmtB family transcription factor [Erythrobacter sp.]